MPHHESINIQIKYVNLKIWMSPICKVERWKLAKCRKTQSARLGRKREIWHKNTTNLNPIYDARQTAILPSHNPRD